MQYRIHCPPSVDAKFDRAVETTAAALSLVVADAAALCVGFLVVVTGVIAVSE